MTWMKMLCILPQTMKSLCFTKIGVLLDTMTANVRFDYFTSARGAFIKSEREDITFRSLDKLETLIQIDANMRAKKYGDEVVGHVMEVH